MQRSLSGIVDFLMPSGDGGALTKIRSFDALLTSPPGADDTSRRQADYIRAAMRCFDGLADLLSGGDAERLEVDNIATAWQNHTQVGDYTAATQVLSLAIVPRMRDFGWRDQIRAFVSRVVPVTTGSDVLVLQFPQGVRRGDYWRRGVCVAVSEVGCFDVRPLPTTGSGRLICFVEDRVPADRVRHADSLICTKHDVQTAANLAMDRFRRGATRDFAERLDAIGIERAALTAAFLRDPSVVVQADGGASTARRKTKWFLKEGVPRLLKRLNRRLADAGLRRSSEAHFRGLLAGPGYAKLTAELCTCERLYNQIDAEERFRSGEFRSHLKEESHVAQHCLCYLLSSENEPCFREPCVHGRKDGSTLSPPKTMEEIVAPRRLTRRDHEDECMVCYGDEGSLLCCAYCAPRTRRRCTAPYQKFVTSTLKDHEYTTIYDYWAKQSAKLHMEGTCEGQGNKGVSCSGRAFTCNNPTSATRAQYPDVPEARAAADAGSDLTCASQYVAACDARRHTGVVNMRVEIDRSLDLTAEEKKRRKSIVGIGDAHFYACPYGGDLRTWRCSRDACLSRRAASSASVRAASSRGPCWCRITSWTATRRRVPPR
ncbi:hypothetical protein JL721_9136 [Aureococcus anophagefferens]|nr:hypothetical protein JL721_9136 [Aureococcus anophagefferens]